MVERYYYKEYKAEASDNIMEKNSFNPYFIKSASSSLQPNEQGVVCGTCNMEE